MRARVQYISSATLFAVTLIFGLTMGIPDSRADKDCDICPEMVSVPGGTYTMGGGVYGYEKPAHRVSIQSFSIGKFEVTFAQYDACVSAGRCSHKPSDFNWGRGNRPVINVSWHDAKAYVRWLSQKTGKGYRLPSDAEWEYAARAGTQTKYSWGDDPDSNKANCKGCGGRWNGKSTAPVGSFPANRFGLHDMHGNVWEWVQDCWNFNYSNGPSDQRARTSGDCSKRVVRGGGRGDSPGDVVSTMRHQSKSGTRDLAYGFRVARTP
jgi:formylglycine-generating enzyme required for sulfatase activity